MHSIYLTSASRLLQCSFLIYTFTFRAFCSTLYICWRKAHWPVGSHLGSKHSTKMAACLVKKAHCEPFDSAPMLMVRWFVLQDKLPLAVVGSNTIIEVNGKRARGRQYPWGVAEGEAPQQWCHIVLDQWDERAGWATELVLHMTEKLLLLLSTVENSDHCDFTILRDMLIRCTPSTLSCYCCSLRTH